MEASLQTRQRVGPQAWTDEDQRQAEELRAQGLSYRAIGREIGRTHTTVRCRLNPEAFEKHQQDSVRWREANRDRARINRHRWYWEDPERARKSARDSRLRNIAECLRKCRNYYRANKQRCLANSRRWADANPEKVKESQRRAERKWRAANPEQVREISRRWRAAHREAARETHRRWRARRRASRRAALVPVSLVQLQRRSNLFGGQCAYCGATGKLTVDHVLPLKLGGLDEAANILPACVRCNCSKQATPVEQWYRNQPFFSNARWQLIQRHCPGAVGQLSLSIAVAGDAQKELHSMSVSTSADDSGSQPGTGGQAASAV